MLEAILIVSTILGGLAALWFFIEKTRTTNWKSISLSRRYKRTNHYGTELSETVESDDRINKSWPIDREPEYPANVRDTVSKMFKNYRLPETSDIISDWSIFGDPKSLNPFFCSGDFRGTGNIDYAFFLIGKDERTFIVAALLTNPLDKLTLIELESQTDYPPQNMFLQTVPPGRYRTVFGKGYDMLGQKGPPVIKLKNESINLGTFESADSIFFWDEKKQQFERAWMSD